MAITKEQKEKQLQDYYNQLESGELKQLSTKSAQDLRKEYWERQGKKCPVLDTEISFEDSTLDHMHRTQDDPYGGSEWLGLVRGVLHYQANSWEGKCYNAFKRLGLNKHISFSEALRNLAEYIDNPSVPYGFIYYSEAPKIKRNKLGKRDYQKVIKHYKNVYPKRKKLPEKTLYMTKAWERMIQDTNAYLERQQKLKRRER